MTLRLSTALRNYANQKGSVKRALQNGKIMIYSGTQPASADAAPTGTLLCTITDTGGAHTAEVQASTTITLTGAAGSIDTLTVDGVAIIDAAVPFNTSLTQTASDLADAINNSASIPDYEASFSGAVVTLKAPRGMGASANALAVAAGTTTLVATIANSGTLAGGVTPANGLKFGTSTAGVLAKLASQAWAGVAVATGTAGWFRFVGSVADSGTLDSSETEVRLDGAIATSGSQLNMSSTSITSGATQTISSFPITLPSA